ncbi:MAG: FeoC-like transcriptional regulator [Paenirhodobacter sp.]|uniref:FeoC-like transcriptional regulator n=1 Tax=Paenirhodobacter sp. TaxID=1965326 RepID=UPI003D127D4F
MLLSELRSYLQEHRRAALFDMSIRFDTDPEALRPMLAKWIAKGKLVRLPACATCGSSCCHCDPKSVEIYEWQD